MIGNQDTDPMSLVDLLACEDLQTKTVALAEARGDSEPPKFTISLKPLVADKGKKQSTIVIFSQKNTQERFE